MWSRSCPSLTLGTLLMASLVMPAFAEAGPQQCQAMQNFSWPHTVISKSTWQPAETVHGIFSQIRNVTYDLPAHCVVEGVVDSYHELGRQFGVRFELRMPLDWNGRFFFQGGGGLDGAVLPAYGEDNGAKPALARGFAVVSMDGGHEGMDASFAAIQQARLDYAYQAVGKATEVAKAAIESFYKRSPQYSYFVGCSNGGREAMIAAERYPFEFNGIVAGDPGFRLSHAAVAEAWNNRALASIVPKGQDGSPDLAAAFSDDDLKLVSSSVLAQCDELDGLKDGMINNQKSCHFSPQILLCQPGQQTRCLSQTKINVLETIMNGPHDSKGNQLYSGFPYDSGIDAIGWRIWMLGIEGKFPAINATMGASSLSLYFLTPAQPGRSPYALDFDHALEGISATGAINDADSTMLSSFVSNGGKLLIYQGESDPVFSALDIAAWYDKLHAADHDSENYARLFMVPGMNHCGGGPATDQFDPLVAVEDWVEKHQAPARILATGESFKGESRPLCVYPAYARYVGGNPAIASSFQCVSSATAR